MNKEVSKKEDQGTELVEHDMVGNYFTSYGDTATTIGSIVGSLLKFNKGDWLLGQDEEEVAPGRKFVAIMDRLDIGWVKWEDSKPVSTKMGKLIEGFVPAKRKDLGDTDEDEWETDATSGNPRDPWQFSNNLIMRIPGTTGEDDDDLVTYATSSRGGVGAVGELCKVYGKEMRSRPDEWPVVEIGVDSYKHSNKEFGRIKIPVLRVVAWEPKVKVSTPKPAAKEPVKTAAGRRR